MESITRMAKVTMALENDEESIDEARAVR